MKYNENPDTPIGNSQPIQNNNAYDNYNNPPNNEQISKYIRWFSTYFYDSNKFLPKLFNQIDTEYDSQYVPTPSYTSNNNGYNQDLYVDDAKDLHYQSQHGSHSTDFTFTHGHGHGSDSGTDGGSGDDSSKDHSRYEVYYNKTKLLFNCFNVTLMFDDLNLFNFS